MAQQTKGLGDRSDVLGLAVGLPVFLVTGLVADVAFHAGLLGWGYACSTFGLASNVTAWRLRRRGADGDLVRRYARLTPGVWLAAIAMIGGLTVLLVGFGASGDQIVLPLAGAALFVGGAASLVRIKVRQQRALRSALRERHRAAPSAG